MLYCLLEACTLQPLLISLWLLMACLMIDIFSSMSLPLMVAGATLTGCLPAGDAIVRCACMNRHTPERHTLFDKNKSSSQVKKDVASRQSKLGLEHHFDLVIKKTAVLIQLMYCNDLISYVKRNVPCLKVDNSLRKDQVVTRCSQCEKTVKLNNQQVKIRYTEFDLVQLLLEMLFSG